MVNVSVGVIGVKVGSAVKVLAGVNAGVGVSAGIKNICSTVREQDEDRMAQMRMAYIFFMAGSV